MKFDPTLYLVTDSTGRTDDDFLSILEKAAARKRARRR